jgi:predicted metal-dependent hydrolase
MMQKLLQRTLDLFASAPEAEADSVPEPVPLSPRASAVATPVALSVDTSAALPLQTLQQALAPATFRHPEATREAFLAGVLVAYAFRRGKRRTIGFSVGAEGLVVSAPRWVPLYEVDRSVHEKTDWILKKLQETRDRHQRMESARIDWCDGASLPFMGGELVLQLDPRQAVSAVLSAPEAAEDASGTPRHVLQLGLAHSASSAQIRDAAQAWLMRHAKRLFEERLNHYAPRLGVSWLRMSLSSAGTRWGSASADGSIRLNWRLIHFKLSVIDYVVVHELSHLRVMDHSPRFWETVRTIVPDYAELRGQLKDEMVPKW